MVNLTTSDWAYNCTVDVNQFENLFRIWRNIHAFRFYGIKFHVLEISISLWLDENPQFSMAFKYCCKLKCNMKMFSYWQTIVFHEWLNSYYLVSSHQGRRWVLGNWRDETSNKSWNIVFQYYMKANNRFVSIWGGVWRNLRGGVGECWLLIKAGCLSFDKLRRLKGERWWWSSHFYHVV